MSATASTDSQSRENEVTIDLTRSSNPHALNAEHFLASKPYKLLFQRMAETIGKIEDFKKSLECNPHKVGYTRVHDVITVHGKRGSGKTTFLFSALSLLKNVQSFKNFEDKFGVTGINAKRICVLDVMDPTLFACREHLLHAILCKISQKVHEASQSHGAINCHGDDSGCVIEKWEKQVSKLAKGLGALGEIREGNERSASSSARWEEAAFSMQAEMDTIQSSMDLERCFYGVVRKALKILEKDAFILALDDIDTRPNIGWHVLEVIRRYLTTPQILVVMSGDLDLLNTIIRREHAKGLGINAVTKAANESPHKERLDGLTEQYLLKILRSNSRINLGNFISALYPLKVLNAADAQKVWITKKPHSEEKCTLHTLLETFFSYIGCHTEKEKNFFRHTLMSTSCRTEMQLLDALFDYRAGAKDKDNIKDSEKDFAFRLCEIYFMQLTNFGISPLEVQEILETPQGLTRFMNVLFKRGYINYGLELVPDRMDSYENEALLALYVNMVQAMKDNQQMAFAYLFKACWLREVIYHGSLLVHNDYEEIARYLTLDSDKPLHYTAKNIAAMLWPNIALNPTRLSSCGTLRIHGESIKKNHKSAIKNMYGVEVENISDENTPSELKEFYTNAKNNELRTMGRIINTPYSLQKNIISWHKELIPLGILAIERNNSSYQLFSIVPMLSILADIFTLEITGTDSINKIFRKHCIINYFALFVDKKDGKDSQNTTSEDNTYNDDEINEYEEKRSDNKELFSREMKKWYNEVKERKFSLSPVLASRIMERFCRSLKRIDSLPQAEMFLGKYIHRCLVAFFNAVLVEEILLGTAEIQEVKDSLRLDNPTGSDDLFVNNFDKVKEHKKYFPFFTAIFSCPLWGIYIKLGTDTWNRYKDIYTKRKDNPNKMYSTMHEQMWKVTYHEKGCTFFNLYPLLNSVAIPKKTEQTMPNTQEDTRTKLGSDLDLPEKQFIKTSTQAVKNMLKHYKSNVNPTWAKSPEQGAPEDFKLFFNKIISECYHDGKDRSSQIKTVWDLVRKA